MGFWGGEVLKGGKKEKERKKEEVNSKLCGARPDVEGYLFYGLIGFSEEHLLN